MAINPATGKVNTAPNKTNKSSRASGRVTITLVIQLRKGRAILAELVSVDPSNARWHKDLAWFDGQIAEVEGQVQGARKN